MTESILLLCVVGFIFLGFSVKIIASNISRLAKRPQTSRIRKLTSKLESDSGFTFPARSSSRYTIATGSLADNRVTISIVPPILKIGIRWEKTNEPVWEPLENPMSREKDYTLQIVITSEELLPPPLEVATDKSFASTKYRVRCAPSKLQDVNISTGIEIFSDQLQTELCFIKRNCHYFSIFDHTLSLGAIYSPPVHDNILPLINSGMKIVSGFRKIMEQTDAIPSLIAYTLNHEENQRKKMECLRLLTTLYRNHAQTKHTLANLLDYPDFEIGSAAAAGLNIDFFTYIQSHIHIFNSVDTLKAVRNLLGTGKPKVVEFLISLYGKSSKEEERCAMLKAFQGHFRPRFDNLFIEALSDPVIKVKLTAISVLSRYGDQHALAALYALRQHSSSSVGISAAAAIQTIKRRLGDGVQGKLSLAGSQSQNGALSLSEDEKTNESSPGS